MGTKFLLIGIVFTDYVLKIRSPLRVARSQILLPYSAKAKPFVNILSGFSLFILGEACFCGAFFFERIYLHFADSLCLHRLGVLSASSLTPGACQFWLRLCLSPRLPAFPNLQRQSRRRLLFSWRGSIEYYSPLFFPLSNHNMACKPLILLDFIHIYSLTYTVIRGIINI